MAFSYIHVFPLVLLNTYFNVNAHVSCIVHNDGAVPKGFACWKISCACGEFKGIYDEISAGGDLYLVWIRILGTIVDGNLCMSYCLVFWNVFDILSFHEINCVCALVVL